MKGLNKIIPEEDLYELFGLQNTTYLNENCCVKIILSESGLSRGFALIRLNALNFKSHRVTIKEAQVKPKLKESSPSRNKTTETKNN